MATVAAVHSSAQRSERMFYFGMACAIGAAVLLGFARSVFLRPWFHEYAQLHAPAEPFFYVHGAFFLLWIVVFVTQTALIASGNTALHRKLGVAGAALIPTMFVLGCVGALIAARRPTGFFDARCCSRRSSCSRR